MSQIWKHVVSGGLVDSTGGGSGEQNVEGWLRQVW